MSDEITGEPGTEVALAGPDVQQAVPAADTAYLDPPRLPGERMPVLPPWMRSRAELRSALVVTGGQSWHRARYYGLRTPAYLIAALWWALVAVFRLVIMQLQWWWVLEQHDLRSQAVTTGDSREWMRLHKEAKETRKSRGTVLAFEALIVAGAVLALVRLAPSWAQYGAAAAALMLLAWLGRPEGRRIVQPAIIPARYEAPTEDSITFALGSLGITAINKAVADGRGITFVSPVMQSGPGWLVHLDLPHGRAARSAW